MKLHLGCGKRHLDGYLNIDARADVGADLVADITNLTSFENEEVEEIYACHVLEHIPRPQVMDVLKHWHRILKPGGILLVSVPDFAALCNLYQDGVPMQRLIGPLCGRQNYPANTHYAVYDYHYLAWLLTEAGFILIRPWTRYDWIPRGWDDYSFAQIDDKTISLNLEARRGA